MSSCRPRGQPDRLRTAVEQRLGTHVDRDAGHFAEAQVPPTTGALSRTVTCTPPPGGRVR